MPGYECWPVKLKHTLFGGMTVALGGQGGQLDPAFLVWCVKSLGSLFSVSRLSAPQAELEVRKHFFLIIDTWETKRLFFCELSPGIQWPLQGIYSGLKGLSTFSYEDFNKFVPFCPGFLSIMSKLWSQVLGSSRRAASHRVPHPTTCADCMFRDFQICITLHLGSLTSYFYL